MRLTNKELIALHLLEFVKYVEALDVPAEMTQEGIARAIRIELPHFKQYVRPLVTEGLVRERTTHVKGVARRRKVYHLTDAGKLFAVRLRENVKAEVVRVRDAAGVREARVAEALGDATGKASILDVIHQVMETGIVDLATLSARAQPSFVEMLGDAPKIESFVGRQDQLSAITQEDGGPRLTVVRGVAGIGKTSLGAKACELLRGRRNLFWHRVQPWDTHQSLLSGIGDFLAALGKPGLRAILRRNEENRAAQILREDLPGTPAFLVFDDAHEVSTEGLAVFRLLKDVVADVKDSGVLILTRKSLPFYDRRDVTLKGVVREIDLGGLASVEIVEFLTDRQATPSLAEIAHGLGGHPLFLELLRSSGHPLPSRALSDIRRFVEEEVYAKISDAERKMMKLVSLYRVPVPRDALFPDSTMSHDVLMNLVNRSLIRPVGEGRFEAHDAIREFFATIVTPSEQQELGSFAVEHLRRLAADADEAGDSLACIGSLSNALELSASKDRRADLLEAIGDAHERIYDHSLAMGGYREALQVTSEPETVARLHRKLADSHHSSEGGELERAFEEAEAGLVALGETSSAEMGWLYVARAHIEGHRGQYERSREDAEAALDVFHSFGVVAGEVSALEELAHAASFEGDSSLAERFLMSALKLVDSSWRPPPPASEVVASRSIPMISAPGWARTRQGHAADIHVMMMHALLRRRQVEQAAEHVAAVTALIDEMEDPYERLSHLARVVWFKAVVEADFQTAEDYGRQAVALARQVHDLRYLAGAETSLAFYAYFQGEIDDARRGFERSFDQLMAQGQHSDAIETLYMSAECSLLQGNIHGFRRAVAAFDDPKIQGAVEFWTSVVKACQGLDRLLAGDQQGFREAFAVALQSANEAIAFPGETADRPPPYLAVSVPHLYYAGALEAIGEQQESRVYLNRALDVLRAHSHKARLTVAEDRQRRLVEVLRRAVNAGQTSEQL